MIQYADHLPGRTVWLDGEEYLYFSGTSYLGMARNEVFAELLREGLARYGTNYSSSRSGNLQLTVYEEAEISLARFAGAPVALTVSSGLLAGQVVIKSLPATSHFLYAPRTHPALWRTEADAFEGDWHQWTTQLSDLIKQVPNSHLVVLTNALDPLQAEAYDFGWVGQLPADKNITLVVDDSHGLGIAGPAGGGIYRQLSQFPRIQLIVIASLGKALGLPGGIVLGDVSIIEKIRQNAYFGGASPVPPAYLYAFLQAEKLYEEARSQLQTNVNVFTQFVQQAGLFRHIPQYPVFNTSAHTLCPFLKARHILISSFPYPTPTSNPVTRIILSSLHESADIIILGEYIREFSDLSASI